MPSPFENPSKLVKDPRGMTYGKAAVLAGGTLAIAYYIMAPRNKHMDSTTTRHDRGTTQQVATNRHGQQHRDTPPSKKQTQDERS